MNRGFDQSTAHYNWNKFSKTTSCLAFKTQFTYCYVAFFVCSFLVFRNIYFMPQLSFPWLLLSNFLHQVRILMETLSRCPLPPVELTLEAEVAWGVVEDEEVQFVFLLVCNDHIKCFVVVLLVFQIPFVMEQNFKDIGLKLGVFFHCVKLKPLDLSSSFLWGKSHHRSEPSHTGCFFNSV